ncbi:MAG: prepilin-type N-terminal cleavage/methylation domain-containing protein [Betaproteobacteria bacterium]
MRKQQGFTLIEIAIVLVIIGLLLGGVLKGQELINAARVRNIASQLDGVKIAYLGFQDRFRVLPGDMPDLVATANIPGAGATGGCGVVGGFCGNGRIDPAENLVVWNQLSHANFISGSYNGAVGAVQTTVVAPTSTTSPVNPYNGFLLLTFDQDFGDIAAAPPNAAMNIKTGGNIPSGTLTELDRKVDDGIAGTGSFRIAPVWDGVTATCYTGALGNVSLTYAAAADIKTCGGASIQ